MLAPFWICNYCKNAREGWDACILEQKGRITKNERDDYILNVNCPYFVATKEWKKEHGNETPKEFREKAWKNMKHLYNKSSCKRF